MNGWWDDPQHRDTASYIVLGFFGAMAAASASLLRQWPKDTWVRALGTWLGSMVAGMLAMAVFFEPLMPLHPWPLTACVISAAWIGSRALDYLAFKALGITLFSNGQTNGANKGKP